MVEIHTVGAPPLLEAVLADLFDQGVRPARPGEFTLRAFLAGRIDLVQAEAVLGVIDAYDHQELEQALRQLAGGLSGKIAQLRNGLIDLLADLEAGLDFVEEEIEFVDRDDLIRRVTTARTTLQTLLDQSASRMQSTGRFRIALAGLPNAGKSTLFNAFAGRQAALVSEIQGTTRDYLSAELDVHGTPLELIDTAGWESESAGIMQHAQSLRSAQLQHADLIVWCSAGDLSPAEQTVDRLLIDELRRQQRPLLVVQTKSDLTSTTARTASKPFDAECPAVSGLWQQGTGELLDRIVQHLSEPQQGNSQFVGTTAARCRESLGRAIESLDQAATAAELGMGEEIVAVELRESLEHLGRLLGSVYTDDILDRIFSKFCIGK